MEALNHKLTLEMTTLNSQVTVRIKKNDTKNKLVISLSENGKPYKLTENVHAVFVGKKPDGKIVFNDCDIVGNKITYTITAQTSVAVGIVACEIRLYDTNDNLLTSPNFTIVVDETVYDADEIEIESENEINVLDSLISEAKALIAEVEASKTSVFIAEYDVTSFDDIVAAIENGAVVFCKLTENGKTILIPLAEYDGTVARFDLQYTVANQPTEWTLHIYSVFVSAAGWDADEINTTGTIIVNGGEVFIAEYGVTTSARVIAAYNNGRRIVCKHISDRGSYVYAELQFYIDDVFHFVSFPLETFGTDTLRYYTLDEANEWEQFDVPLGGGSGAGISNITITEI